MKKSFYQFELKNLQGRKIDFEVFQKKYVLIVNTASECGFTPQYKALQELYESIPTLDVLACPCNDFGAQEPETAENIGVFCERNYGVTFNVSQKITILDNPHPLFEWLCMKKHNGLTDFEVDWNFCKFLVDPEGNLIGAWKSAVEPYDDNILSKIADY